jgi:putative redox protein
MTLRMYADRKGVPLDRVTVAVSHGKVHANDCAECSDNELLAGRSGMIDRFERAVTLAGDDLTDAHRSKLLEIADKCPVHRTLESASSIVTHLSD